MTGTMSADDHLQAERHASAMGIRSSPSASYRKAVQEEAEELAMLEDRPGTPERVTIQEMRPRSPDLKPRFAALPASGCGPV